MAGDSESVGCSWLCLRVPRTLSAVDSCKSLIHTYDHDDLKPLRLQSYSRDDTLATWVSNIQRSIEEYRSDIKAVACYSHCFSITMSRSTSTDGIAFALLEESSQNALSEVASSHGDSQDISIADNHFLHEPTSARSRISTQSSDNSDALSYYSATSSSFHSEEDVEWEML